jgi:hypothetical protein
MSQSVYYIKLKILHVSVCVNVLWLLLCGLNIVFIACSQYKLHRVNFIIRKFSPYKSNHSTYIPYKLIPIFTDIKNILIHNDIYQVLKNSHYHILTTTHPHIHSGKTRRREHGDLLNIPAVTPPTATLRTPI